MLRFLSIAALAVSLATPLWAEKMYSSISAMYADFEESFEDLHGRNLGSSLAHHGVAGMSIVMIKNDWITHKVYGLRNMPAGKPTGEHTIYQAASMSKMVAGFGFARAHRLGEIDLDQSVADFIATRPNGDTAEWVDAAFKGDQADFPETITMRRLLKHAGGLDTHGIGTFAANDPCDNAATLVIGHTVLTSAIPNPDCPGVRPIWTPGKRYDYSGGGYTVAEMMFKEATGQSLRSYLNTHILAAYGLDRSTFDKAQPIPKMARGCSQPDCVLATLADVIETTSIKAAGGLIAHPEDYGILLQLIANDGKDAAGTRIIPLKDIRAVMTPARFIDHQPVACQADGGCPSINLTTFSEDAGEMVTVSKELSCFKNMCRHHLNTTPENPGSSHYGLGVKLRHTLASDGYPRELFHGGSQPGASNEFLLRRDERAGIVVFVNGEGETIEDVRGGRFLADEVIDGFEEAFGY